MNMCWTARALPANCRRLHLTTKTRSAQRWLRSQPTKRRGPRWLGIVGSLRSWTGRVRSVWDVKTKKLVSGHFGQNCGAVDAIDGIGNVHQKQLPGTGRWSTSHAMGAWCAQRLRTHQAWARRGLEKVACAPVHRMKRSCRDKAPRWPSDEGIHWVWRKGQQGGTAKPGSNLRRRSALELDGNHFSQEAKEVIPGGGTERSTQVMERRRRRDRTEGLAHGVDADTTIGEIGKGSESSERSSGCGPG